MSNSLSLEEYWTDAIAALKKHRCKMSNLYHETFLETHIKLCRDQSSRGRDFNEEFLNEGQGFEVWYNRDNSWASEFGFDYTKSPPYSEEELILKHEWQRLQKEVSTKLKIWQSKYPEDVFRLEEESRVAKEKRPQLNRDIRQHRQQMRKIYVANYVEEHINIVAEEWARVPPLVKRNSTDTMTPESQKRKLSVMRKGMHWLKWFGRRFHPSPPTFNSPSLIKSRPLSEKEAVLFCEYERLYALNSTYQRQISRAKGSNNPGWWKDKEREARNRHDDLLTHVRRELGGALGGAFVKKVATADSARRFQETIPAKLDALDREFGKNVDLYRTEHNLTDSRTLARLDSLIAAVRNSSLSDPFSSLTSPKFTNKSEIKESISDNQLSQLLHSADSLLEEEKLYDQ